MQAIQQTPLVGVAIALSLGMITMILARKIKIVPIGLLLLIGIVSGPQMLNLFNPELLKDHLQLIISLGITIILFEGGLTLDYSNYRKIGVVVTRLLIFGTLITWIVNGLAIYYLFDFPLSFSLFSSSLIVVTGPTVISPLLRRMNINKKLYNILHWEGVLIDPIGVFLAILCFEIVLSEGRSFQNAFTHLFIQFFSGIGIGGLLGYLAVSLLNRKWIPDELSNAFVLTIAITTFSICDFIAPESGILGVIIAGMTIGMKKKIPIDDIKKFKLELTEIFIGFLFIALAASLNLSQIRTFSTQGTILIVIVIFFTRPLSIFLCGIKSNLTLKEKLFVSWIAPRGIIAASIATIFSISLRNHAQFAHYAWFIETFTFITIIITVVFQGFSASFVAKALNVSKKSHLWVIVGAHHFSVALAKYLKNQNIESILIDNNLEHVTTCQQEGVNVVYANSLSTDLLSTEKFLGASHLIALTDNVELNQLICLHWKKIIKRENLFRWNDKEEKNNDYSSGQTIWSHLESPSTLSQKIFMGDCKILEENYAKNGENWKKQGLMPLMQISSKNIFWKIKNNEKNLFNDQKPWFILEDKHSLQQISIIPKEFLFFQQEKMSEILEQIVHRLQKNNDFSLPKDYISYLSQKTEDHNISIGEKISVIAFPIENIKEIDTIVAWHHQGLNIVPSKEKKVQLIFFICYPPAEQKAYYSYTTKISHVFSYQNHLEMLEKVKNVDELREYFTTIDKRS